MNSNRPTFSDSGLAAGYGETVITPASDVPLDGYGYDYTRYGESVRDELKARAVLLSDGEQRLLIVVCDLLNVLPPVDAELRQAIAERCGIPAGSILIGAIHTHGGPWWECEAYRRTAVPKIVEAAVRAEADLAPVVSLRTGSLILEPVGFNRRERNFHGIDSRLSAFFIARCGKPELVFWHYACHPVIFGPRPRISADFPGEVNRRIEEANGRGLFLQRCCGEIDPVTNLNRWGAGDDSDIEAIGALIFNRIGKVRRDAAEVPAGPLEINWRHFALPLAVPASEVEIDREIELREGSSDAPGFSAFLHQWGRRAKAKLAAGRAAPELPQVAMALCRIGGLAILTLPGEPFAVYDAKLTSAHPGLLVWGYGNGHIGYLPSAEAYRNPDDYACYQICKLYDHLFAFTPAIEEILLTQAESLLNLETV